MPESASFNGAQVHSDLNFMSRHVALRSCNAVWKVQQSDLEQGKHHLRSIAMTIGLFVNAIVDMETRIVVTNNLKQPTQT